MLAKPEVACAIIEGISSLREVEELQDFVVEVEGKEFKCHRLILGACSGFFRGLFRSGMKESLQQRSKLEGVSMETFAIILEILYTGSVNLTRDNMLNVWLAADQLQITVINKICLNFIFNNICNETVIPVWKVASQLMQENIIKLCQTFITNNLTLQNWETFYIAANSIGSDLILSHIRDFIKKNFENVCKSEKFLCLRENDLLEIIKSQDLVVSCEDVVVESVLNWVNNGITNRSANIVADQYLRSKQNEEKEHELNVLQDHVNKKDGENKLMKTKYSTDTSLKCLERLLSEIRLCLVKPLTLEKLFRHPLVVNNTLSKEMVMDATLYQSIGHQHGQWPKGAVHRCCSDLENVGVVGIPNGHFQVFRKFHDFDWWELPRCSFLNKCRSVKLCAYMSNLFAIGDLVTVSSLCVFGQSDWRKLCQLPGNGWLGVAVEEFIYLINTANQQIKRIIPRLGNCILEDFISFTTQDKIEHVCSFDNFIIVFCSEVVKGKDETAVHCLDTRSQTWRRLDSLEGSAKSLVSFKKEKQSYIIQNNGNMWEMKSECDECRGIHLNWVGILWQGNYELYGAICFNDVLYLEGSTCIDEKILPVPLFSSIITDGAESSWSNIVPAVLKKSVFTEF